MIDSGYDQVFKIQMDKHGIGTDATHADHIETVKQRQYIGVTDNDKLVPGSRTYVNNQQGFILLWA